MGDRRYAVSLKRRAILKSGLALLAAGAVGRAAMENDALTSATASIPPESALPTRWIITVEGPIPAAEAGIMLPHEHVMVDFIGADQVDSSRYDADEVFSAVRPHLERVQALGARTICECTPAWIGRDPELLRRLAAATGLRLVTNTGYYGAGANKYLPAHALTESAGQLAERWIAEWRDGIGQTGIRPGFIKIGVDAGPLSDVHRKLVAAAARAQRATGLTIAAHTGDGIAALEELDVLRAEAAAIERFIWVHAQSEPNPDRLLEAARAGAWVELDGIGPDTLDQHLTLMLALREAGLLGRVLLSHDAGWYTVGEPGGGAYRGHDTLFTDFIPLLRERGFSQPEIDQLIIHNPAKAFAVERLS